MKMNNKEALSVLKGMLDETPSDDDASPALRKAVWALERHGPTNGYDRNDVVKRGAVIIAGAMKCAEYKVRNPETGEYGESQFHMLYDNHVMAMMGASSARLFADFVHRTLGDEPTT